MMRTRPGIARLLPLAALTGLAAGTIALLASARAVQAPGPATGLVATDTGFRDPSPLTDPATPPTTYPTELVRREAWLNQWRMRGADFSGLTLTAWHFYRADLRGANFRGAALRGCNLRDSKLEHADLRGAIYDRDTRWPADFDPRARGARLEE
jgi:uncharacterized protein YjbI with pentapeptide repeats